MGFLEVFSTTGLWWLQKTPVPAASPRRRIVVVGLSGRAPFLGGAQQHHM
jgi:hypothetical protein